MNTETKTLSRQELYEKIWSTPIHKLAKEFRLSDVGLAKLCKRHAIPRPGSGYWRRTETGQMLPRTPLSVVAEPIPTGEDRFVTCCDDLRRVLGNRHKQRVLWAWFHRMEAPAVPGNCYQLR